MKKLILFLLVYCPVILFAQKGTIIPDIKPQASSSTPPDIKVWNIDDYLLDCMDSTSKCYLIKENGANKTVPVNDVSNFVFEEGNKYTVWVKEELKTPPISANAGIYTYTVTKIISKKQSTIEIPVVSKNEIQKEATDIPVETSVKPAATADKQVYYVTKSTPTEEQLTNDVAELKKQIRELKKQVEVMQLQLEMQLKLVDKK